MSFVPCDLYQIQEKVRIAEMEIRWKVVVLFNEMFEDEEGNNTDERTIMYERNFWDYDDMQNFVSECSSNGALDGQVYRLRNDGLWEYYMEVCR